MFKSERKDALRKIIICQIFDFVDEKTNRKKKMHAPERKVVLNN